LASFLGIVRNNAYLCAIISVNLVNSMMKTCFSLFVAAVALLLSVGCSSPSEQLPGTDEERAYDALQRAAKWEEIVRKYQEQPAQSLACRKVALLAWYRLGRGDRSTVFECLENAHEVLTTETAALMMSDVYMQLGMVAMAQRAAFEAMVKMGDVKNCERPLRRLTESALIMGQTELTVKYASLLEEFSSSRKWARRMKQLARHPELIDEASGIGKLKKQYEHTEDTFFL
jgi:hypothetical protein